MQYVYESLIKALALIGSLDRELLRISWTSIWVAASSTTLAAFCGLILALLIARERFRGKNLLVTVLNTLMALPTVVVGLLVYSFICRKSMLGDFELLYTPYAMIIGQFILATPIIAALTYSALAATDERVEMTARTLGATRFQSLLAIVAEARAGVIAAILAGFGRVFAEVGVSMMLGGNIRNYTRNITTAIAFETSRGEFSLALALGIILLVFALGINLVCRLLVRSAGTSVLKTAGDA